MANANYNLSSTFTINASQAISSLKQIDTNLTSLSAKVKSTQAAFSGFGAGATGLNNVSTSVAKTGQAVDQLNLKSKALGTGFTQSAGQINSAVTSINTPLNTTTQSALKLDTSFKQIPGSMRQIDSSSASNTASLGRVNQSALGNIQSQTSFRAKLADTSQEMGNASKSSDNFEKSGVRLQDRIGGIVSRLGGMVFSVTGIVQAYSEAIAMSSLLEQSQARVQEATVALSQALIEHGASSSEAVRAQQELTDAQRALSFQNRVTMLSWQDMIPFAVLLGITSSKLASQHLPALLKGKQAVTKAADALGNSLKSGVTPSLNIFGSAAKSADVSTKPLAPTMVATSGALRTYTGAANTATVATNGLKFSIRSLLVATGIGAGLVAASIAFDAWQRSSEAAANSTTNFSSVTKEATNQINPLIEKVDATTEAFKNQVNQIDVLIGKYKEIPGAVITPGIGKTAATAALTPDQFLKQRAVANTNDLATQKRMYDMVNKAGGTQLNKLSTEQIRERLEGLRGKYQDSEIDYLKAQALQFESAQGRTGSTENLPFGAENKYQNVPLSDLTSQATAPSYSEDQLNMITEAQNKYNQSLGQTLSILPNIALQKGNVGQLTTGLSAAYAQLNPNIQNATKNWDGLDTIMGETHAITINNSASMKQFQGTTTEMSNTMSDYVGNIAGVVEQSKKHAEQEKAHQAIRSGTNQSLVETAQNLHLNEDAIKANTASYDAETKAILTSNASLSVKNAALTKLILEQGKYENAVYNAAIAEGALQAGAVAAVTSFNDLLTSSIQAEQQTRVYDMLLQDHATHLGVELPAGIEKTTKNMELLVTAAKGNTEAFKELQKQLEESIKSMEELGAKATDAMLKGMKDNGKKFTKEAREMLETWLKDSTIEEFETHAKLKFNEKTATDALAFSLNTVISKVKEMDLDPATPTIELSPETATLLETSVQAMIDKIPKLIESGDLGDKAGKNLTAQLGRAMDLLKQGDYSGAIKQLSDTLSAPGGIGSLDATQIKTNAEAGVKEGLGKAKTGMSAEATKVGKAVSEAFYKGWEGGGTIGNEATGEKGSLDKKGMKFPAPDMTDFQSAVTTGMGTAKTTIVQNATLAMTDFGTEMTTGFTNTQAATDTFVTDFGTRINQMSEMMILETGKINEEFALSTGQWATNFDTFITLFGERINQMSEMMLLETGMISEELVTSLETWATSFDTFITAYGERINQMSDMMLLETGVIGEELAVSLEGYIVQFDEFIVQYGERINQMSDIMLLEAGAIEEELQGGIDVWQNQITSFIDNYTKALDEMSDIMAEEAEQMEDELQGGIDQWQRQIKSFISNFEKSIDTMSDTVADEVAEVNKELDKIKKEIKVNVSVNVNKSGGNQFGGSYKTEPFQPQLLMVGEGARREEVNIRPAGTAAFKDERQKEIDKGTVVVADRNSRGGGSNQPIVYNETIILQNNDGTTTTHKRTKVFGGLGSH